jgi:O-antigen/teichoic acid export membrane protein
MNQNERFFSFGRQISYVILTNIVSVMLGIIQVPIITRALGAASYGILALITTAISLIVPFSMLTFSSSIIRFLAAEKDPTKIKEDFYSACILVLVTGTIFALLFFLASDFLANSIFKSPDSIYSLKLSSILIMLNSMFPVLLAFFRRGSKIGIYNALNLGLNILQFSLLVVFLLRGYALNGAILSTILSTLLMNVVALIIIFKQVGLQRPRFKNMKTYLKFGIPLTPNPAILWIIQASDRYMISYFMGISAAGIYNAAYGIGSYASFALWPVGIVLFPIISKAYDEGKFKECENYIKYSFKYLMMITIPISVGVSILANPILKILTTPEFLSGAMATPLIALGAALFCVYQIASYIIYLAGKTYLTLRIYAIGAIANVILNLVLIPRIGLVGAGLASFLAYGIMGLLTLSISRKYIHFDLSIIFIIKSFLSSAVMALFIWIIRPESLIMLAVSIVTGTILYFLALIVIKGFTKDELRFFRAFIINIFKLNKEVNI